MELNRFNGRGMKLGRGTPRSWRTGASGVGDGVRQTAVAIDHTRVDVFARTKPAVN